MEKEKIRELFLSESNYPFKTNDCWAFFGYSKKSNFIRYINSKDKEFDYLLKDDIINSRKREEGFLSRKMFLILLEESKLINDCHYDWYVDFRSRNMEKRILNFKNTDKKKEYRVGIYDEKISGYYYTYSLSTYNLAVEIGIDPTDLFVFFKKNYMIKYGIKRVDFIDKYDNPTPSFIYDNFYHAERYIFFGILKAFLKEYTFSTLQKKLLVIFIELIKELLDKQCEIDIKAKRYLNRADKYRSKKSSFNKLLLGKVGEKELKELYRKTAVLCHPDKNINGEELFKKLNNANENRNLSEMKKIHKACQNI